MIKLQQGIDWLEDEQVNDTLTISLIKIGLKLRYDNCAIDH